MATRKSAKKVPARRVEWTGPSKQEQHKQIIELSTTNARLASKAGSLGHQLRDATASIVSLLQKLRLLNSENDQLKSALASRPVTPKPKRQIATRNAQAKVPACESSRSCCESVSVHLL
jgi:hypothetical protein